MDRKHLFHPTTKLCNKILRQKLTLHLKLLLLSSRKSALKQKRREWAYSVQDLLCRKIMSPFDTGLMSAMHSLKAVQIAWALRYKYSHVFPMLFSTATSQKLWRAWGMTKVCYMNSPKRGLSYYIRYGKTFKAWKNHRKKLAYFLL